MRDVLGFSVPAWVEDGIWEFAINAGLPLQEAYDELVRRGLDIDQMWAIDAAMIESEWATKH